MPQRIAAPSVRRPEVARQLCWVELQLIRPNPHQPRQTFSQDALVELAQSIRQYGLLSPLVVRRMGLSEYELIAGERRLRALKLLGETHAHAIVLPAFDQDSALIALIENLQREELTYFEEADAYQAILRDHGMTQEELARRIGRSPSSVANRLRLLRLPPAVRDRLSAGSLSERHARALLRLDDEKLQRQAVEQAIAQKMGVRQLEELIEEWIKSGGRPDPPGRRMRMYCRDHRMLVNAIMDTVGALAQTGVGVTGRIIEHEQSVEVVVTVPKGPVDKRPTNVRRGVAKKSAAAQPAIGRPAGAGRKPWV
ncbi:MAG: ParB/RepB/Spo0J family partition protein [Clostridiales bacterium]|nr:ParB/RepB/Spo0J family partition protein [Clostridiales bacterium]